MSNKRTTLPPSVNFHLLNACNFKCGFCFAVFDDSAEYLGKGQLPPDQQLAIVDAVAEAGVTKITFAGGEPLLSKNLEQLLERSKQHGLTTMVVTNGSRLTQREEIYQHLDWLVLSVDSVREEINVRSGRAERGETAMSAEQYLDVAQRARAHNVRVKLNTVVHQINLDEDLVPFVLALRPERWKIFQVLPVENQNGSEIDRFEITAEQFVTWVDRHDRVADEGVVVVTEDNDEMRGTYAMIDPAGRFYDSSSGSYVYSRPILEVGIEAAFAQVNFDHERYVERGGQYDWSNDSTEAPAAVVQRWREVTYSRHARNRMKQRRISEADVQWVLAGLQAQSARQNCSLYKLDPEVQDQEWWTRQLQELTVVFDEQADRVVTVYWNDHEARQWVIDAMLDTKHTFVLADALKDRRGEEE